MKTDYQPDLTQAVFLQNVSVALSHLKQQLQNNYQHAYPQLAEIIHLVLEEEENNAWRLSSFPHLLLPDLVEAHIANLNLRPVEPTQDDIFIPNHFHEVETHQPAFALCR